MKFLIFLLFAGVSCLTHVENSDLYQHDCLASVTILSDPLHYIPANEIEMSKHCQYIIEMEECAISLLEVSPNDMPMRALANALKSYITDVCPVGSPSRKLILDAAPCVRRNFQAIGDCIVNNPGTLQEQCQYYVEYVGCMYLTIDEACSKNATLVAEKIYGPYNQYVFEICGHSRNL